ncbi:MAG: threonylcarbamoyl-AMP synthase [Verrucomicrobia bacterium]|nr:threonylcarbamoyl-AMP synthase [Verrucomicrobiota bacterium]
MATADDAPELARLLPTHTPDLFRAAVREAASLLRQGELVALPTETVYGLAANALDPAAVRRIFEVKGRPSHNPIIVHVASLDQTRQCVRAWPEIAESLARAFWPGPLTLVLPRSKEIPDEVTAGGDTVGVRWPSHPLIQAVIAACGFPLAAPSANLSEQLSPTNADHVRQSLGRRIRLIVDGGQAQVGIESTVLDLSGHEPRILRPGMIHAESLLAVVGKPVRTATHDDGPLLSPGQLPRHYAPSAPLGVLAWADEADLLRQLAARRLDASSTQVLAHTVIPTGSRLGGVSVIPHDPEAFARALYAELHRCDAARPGSIVVEAVPDTTAWFAIADRLRRASA